MALQLTINSHQNWKLMGVKCASIQLAQAIAVRSCLCLKALVIAQLTWRCCAAARPAGPAPTTMTCPTFLGGALSGLSKGRLFNQWSTCSSFTEYCVTMHCYTVRSTYTIRTV